MVTVIGTFVIGLIIVGFLFFLLSAVADFEWGGRFSNISATCNFGYISNRKRDSDRIKLVIGVIT